jgi:hypothetical protein
VARVGDRLYRYNGARHFVAPLDLNCFVGRLAKLVSTVLIAVLQVAGVGGLLILLLLLSGSLGVLFGLLAMRAGRPTGGKVIAAINGMGLLIAVLFLLLALFRLPSV